MTLTQDILQAAGKGAAGLDEAERLALLRASEKLMVSLETPVEKFMRHFFNIYNPIAIRLAVDLNLVDIALAKGEPITVAELAEKSNADGEFIHRLLRLLITIEVFTETPPSASEQTYTVTHPFGTSLATNSPLRSAVLHHTHLFPSTSLMPSYFSTNGYKNPTDARHGPFSFAQRCDGETYFDHISRPENIRMATAFHETMALHKSGEEGTFVSSYPVLQRLQNTDPERVLFVDIGGGVGHQLLKFRDRVAGVQGRYVLLDLPGAIAQATKLPDAVEKVAHDMFEPLPVVVHGAKAFYLRFILHDWPQVQARTILRNIVDVMKVDSVVLIHELLLSSRGVGQWEAKLDWHMMNLGSLERSEEQWRALVGSVGLEIRGIWWEEEGSQGRRALIECGLKE